MAEAKQIPELVARAFFRINANGVGT